MSDGTLTAFDVTVMMVVKARNRESAVKAAESWLDVMCDGANLDNGTEEVDTAWIEFVEPTQTTNRKDCA